MFKKGGKVRDRPPPLPHPEISGKCVLTAVAGTRILDIDMLKKGLEIAQLCGHASLILCEINNNIQQDLCSLLGFICRECRKLTAFASSKYSRELKNYSVNLDIFTTVVEESYGSLVKYMVSNKSGERLSVRPSGDVRLIVEYQDPEVSEEPSPPPKPVNPCEESFFPYPVNKLDTFSGHSTLTAESTLTSASAPSSDLLAVANDVEEPKKPLDSTTAVDMGPAASKKRKRQMSSSPPSSSSDMTMTAVKSEVMIKEEPEEAEILTVDLDPLQSEFGDGDEEDERQRQKQQQQAHGAPDRGSADQLASSLRAMMGPEYLNMLNIMTQIQNSYSVPANTPVMGGSVTPWPPARPITTSASLFIRTTCQKFGLPPGVYEYYRANGLRSVLVVKPEGGDYDSILKFFLLAHSGGKNRSNSRATAVEPPAESSTATNEGGEDALQQRLHQDSPGGSVQRDRGGGGAKQAHLRPSSSSARKKKADDKKKLQKNVKSKRTPLSVFSSLYSVWIKEKNPDMSNQEVGYTVIDKWTKITDKEKEIYRQAVLDDELFDALTDCQDQFKPFYQELERR